MREEAAALRAEGLSYQAIGQRLGVSNTTVWRWFNPEAYRESNLRRNAAKRRWDRDNRWEPCPRCGSGMFKGAKQCRDCFCRSKF